VDRRSREAFAAGRTALLSEAAREWDFEPRTAAELDGFENHIFEVARGGRPFVLRLCHSLHRTAALVCAELHWLDFLARRGLPVAAPVPGRGGALARVIPAADSFFVASLCAKAPGRRPLRSDYSDRFFENWGELVGRIHRVTREYLPLAPPVRRFHWHEDPTLDPAPYRPAVDDDVLARFARIVAQLRALPVDRTAYGLIHNDLHPGNFFIDGDCLTAFDFDDCHYQFLVNDVAMALFYALPLPARPRTAEAFAETFLPPFLRGYRRHAALGPEDLRRLPMFLKLRELDLYSQIVLHLGADVGGWPGAYLEGRRDRILADRPVVDLDFAEF